MVKLQTTAALFSLLLAVSVAKIPDGEYTLDTVGANAPIKPTVVTIKNGNSLSYSYCSNYAFGFSQTDTDKVTFQSRAKSTSELCDWSNKDAPTEADVSKAFYSITSWTIDQNGKVTAKDETGATVITMTGAKPTENMTPAPTTENNTTATATSTNNTSTAEATATTNGTNTTTDNTKPNATTTTTTTTTTEPTTPPTENNPPSTENNPPSTDNTTPTTDNTTPTEPTEPTNPAEPTNPMNPTEPTGTDQGNNGTTTTNTTTPATSETSQKTTTKSGFFLTGPSGALTLLLVLMGLLVFQHI